MIKTSLNWGAAAASMLGLFFTLRPPGAMTNIQITVTVIILIIFGAAAIKDIKDEMKRSVKEYRSIGEINEYMHQMLKNCGACEICSRDASWIDEKRIFSVLKSKSKKGELTLLVHKKSNKVIALEEKGAIVFEYGTLGFDPLTRFTIVNAGNSTTSYVAIGRRKLNEPHTIEEFDVSHPAYSMAADLIRLIKISHDSFKKK
jgi:hypothetical protein